MAVQDVTINFLKYFVYDKEKNVLPYHQSINDRG